MKNKKTYSEDLYLKTNKRKKYKSTSTWLYSLYRKNKEKIDLKLKDVQNESKFRVFKHLVLEYSKKDLTDAEKQNLSDSKLNKYLNQIKDPEKTLKKFLWSDKWSEYKERANENLIQTLKEYKALNTLKELTDTPKNKKIDFKDIIWNREDKVYEYKGYRIDLSNSPKGISFYKIDKEKS